MSENSESDSSGDVIGTLDDSNNILLTGNLADGTYTLKYENEDGTYTEIGTLEVGALPEVVEPVTVDISLVENVRVSLSMEGHTAASGHTSTEIIDLSAIPKPCTIRLTGIIWSALSADAYISTVAGVINAQDGTDILKNYTYPQNFDGGAIIVNDDAGTDVTITITNESAYSAVFGSKGAIANASATLTYTPKA